MPKFKDIRRLAKKQALSGEEPIPVSAEEFITPLQIVAMVTPEFTITTDESYALNQRDGRIYIVVPKK